MLIKPAETIRVSEVTLETVYLNRRTFLHATAALPQYLHAAEDDAEATFQELVKSTLSTDEVQTEKE